jgi:hypothetical protein
LKSKWRFHDGAIAFGYSTSRSLKNQGIRRKNSNNEQGSSFSAVYGERNKWESETQMFGAACTPFERSNEGNAEMVGEIGRSCRKN